MGSGLPHLATVAISRARQGAFLSHLSFPLVPWRGVPSRAGAEAWWQGASTPTDPRQAEPVLTACQNQFSGTSPASPLAPRLS